MDRIAIQKVLHFKLDALKEANEGQANPDLHALSEAKAALLTDLLELAYTLPTLQAFLGALREDLTETARFQRTCRNPFMVAAFQVKIGTLEDVQALLSDPDCIPSRAQAPRRAFLVAA